MNNIIHFIGEDVSLKDISGVMASKNEQYYTVSFNKRNELHIVKHDNGYFKVNEMVNELLKFYTTNEISLDENLTIKGNDDFAIIYNIHTDELVNRMKTDLNTLLKK